MRQNPGPRLERNGFGIFEIRWTENRRSMRKSTHTSSETEASSKLGEFLIARAAGAETNEPVKAGQILDDYLREHVEEGKVTDKQRQRDLARNLRQFFGDMYVKDIMPKDVTLYCKKRGDGTVGGKPAKSNGTLRRELNGLVAAINYAVRTKRLLGTDAPYIPLPQAPGAKDLWLTEEEELQFLDAAEEENKGYPLQDRGYLFAHVALGTASRRHAIETLTWTQVDFAVRRIDFTPKGRQQTAKRRVPVAISERLLPVLQKAYELRTSEYVLHAPTAITARFDAICQRAFKATGNRKFLKVTPHTLRHTWATLAARSGKVTMFDIAGVLGDSLATVQKNYLHHCPEHLRAAVNFRIEPNKPRLVHEMPTEPEQPPVNT